jgi:hypothetical protein
VGEVKSGAFPAAEHAVGGPGAIKLYGGGKG